MRGWRSSRWLHSLVTRVLLVGLFIILMGTATRAYVMSGLLRGEINTSLESQQRELALHAAHDVAQKIRLRQDSVQRLARSLPQALLAQPDALRDWLQQSSALLAQFPSGLWVEQTDGKPVAAYPALQPPFKALQPADTDKPQTGYLGPDAAVVVSALLRGVDGRVLGVLRGANTLKALGLFDPVQNYRNGQNGGYLLALPQEGLWLGSTDASLKLLPPPGMDALLDRAGSGLQGTGVWPHAQAGEQVAAVVAVADTGWSMLAFVPADESDVIVQHILTNPHNGFPLVLLFYILGASLVLYFLLSPLLRVAKLADRMGRGEIPMEPLPIIYNDEIGDLTAAFNRLMHSVTAKSKELSAQKEIAETATQAKSRFLAAASHDLRQPMHALNLYLGALANYDLPGPARPVLASARYCAQTMDEMFRALLDISRLDANVMPAELSVFPIAGLLETIRLEFLPQAQAKGLKLRIAPCAACVVSDPELLERILRNLVSNAVRYTVQGTVLVGCRRTASGLRLSVMDTGPGIAPDQLRAVFEEFHQIGNPERDRTQGLGLGLAIVQRLALLLKAPLSLASQLGRGSVFTVDLPRAAPEADVPASTLSPRLLPHHSLVGALVAVVDDEALILDATRLLLEQWGCTVVSAGSGAEIVERLGACARVPDAIVCDYRLRNGETGMDVIAALRNEFNCDIPALLITGDTAQDAIQAIFSTALPVLHKPLQEQALRDALSQLLRAAA